MEKEGMKKTLAYTLMAILLGTVVMLFPVMMLYPSRVSTTSGLAPPPLAPETFRKEVQDLSAEVAEAEGIAAFPSSLIYAGLIFLTGFIVALSIFQYYKRRTV